MLQVPSPCGQELGQTCCPPTAGHSYPYCSAPNLVCYSDDYHTTTGTACQAFDTDCGTLGKKCCPDL